MGTEFENKTNDQIIYVQKYLIYKYEIRDDNDMKM